MYLPHKRLNLLNSHSLDYVSFSRHLINLRLLKVSVDQQFHQYQIKWTSHLNSLNTKIMTYDVGNPDPGLGQAQTCGRVQPVNEIPTLPSWYLKNDNLPLLLAPHFLLFPAPFLMTLWVVQSAVTSIL